MELITSAIEDKTAVWFSQNNRYVVFEPVMAELVKGIEQKVSDEVLIEKICGHTQVASEEAKGFLKETKALVAEMQHNEDVDNLSEETINQPKSFFQIKYYSINGKVFCIRYGNRFLLDEIHLKFAHLEIGEAGADHNISVYHENNLYALKVDEVFYKEYSWEEFHYLQGKLSMFLIMLSYEKPENDWLGVFHASAVAYQDKCTLLLGDSGNGKSTALALLLANGFDCLADDFVPMDAENQLVYSFAAAISIKEKSLPVLQPYFKNLNDKTEYTTRLGKRVSYVPSNTDYTRKLSCNTLIFIKYKAGAEVSCQPISKIDAFQQLVPDSWLSPEPENAQRFLNWFKSVKTFQLTYSETEDLTASVKTILNDNL